MILVMACIHPSDNTLSSDGVLFWDGMLLGVSWDDVLFGLSGSSRAGNTGDVTWLWTETWW